MQTPDRPIDEEFRTMALDGLAILDTEPDPDFDRIVDLGKELFQVPMCLVSLVDRNRQWFKAKVGLDAAETPRDISFCGHAILAREVLIVRDASQDPRFHDNPLVAGPPHIRFYVGAPITLPNGYTIGTVCIISPEPRPDFGDADAKRLASLADLAVNALTVRALRQDLDRERASRMRLLRAIEAMDQPLALVDRLGHLEAANAAFAAMCEGYVAPGSSILDQTSITLEDLESAAGSEGGVRLVRLTGNGLGQAVSVYVDDTGFILCGSVAPS